MTFTADTATLPLDLLTEVIEYRLVNRAQTPNLIEVFRAGIEAAPSPPTPEEVEAIMAWATDPNGLDWQLLERLEDWDEPIEE